MSPSSEPVTAPSAPAQGSLHAFFAPGGVLSRTHPAYEFRRGQLQMAEAVERALAERRHLIVEAGTGTGKTLAYLVPAIRAGRRVIVSTGTKTLQEQLYYKDIPFLERAVYPDGRNKLNVCYMKGRNNYLCRQKLYDLKDQPVLSGLREVEHLRLIVDWEKTTINGDRSELTQMPEDSQLWSKLDARSDACVGQKCRQYERCFITEMRRRATESDIIIVNHHLFFADLAIKQAAEDAPDAGILPEAAAVIFDEAHELEDVATSYFGVSISNVRFDQLVRDVENTLKSKKLLIGSVQPAAQSLRERSQFFFSLMPTALSLRGDGEGRFEFSTRREFLEENGDEYVGLMHGIGRLQSELQSIKEKPDEIHNLIRRCEELRVQLQFVMESQDRNTVFWIERRSSRGHDSRGPVNVFIQATPIDVSQILRQCLFQNDDFGATVLTSATLAVSGGYQYIRARLGVENARELVVPSHFDYQSQAMLYIPPDLPDPRTPQFAKLAADRIRTLLEITQGRAFCLFTSYAQMRDIYRRLEYETEYPLLLQGTAPKNALLEEFRTTPNAVLFATASFWQGVDVQGEQLSCVIIDRLPFAVPTDPVVAARVRAIDADGGNAFSEYQVPSAVITLKQGFGRLIR
ncbi:MAG: ATP-dependent DNA helicase, partial [Acidobacteriaceae bacterium]|nr:ATP-dependent DNA helicase [Acidobacteriaceae bacterium]